jgi:hypothetical protein
MEKRLANKILTNLDRTASQIEKFAQEGHIDQKLASELVSKIDNFSDQLEVSVYGEKSFLNRKAKVYQSDRDEPYMSTFDNPNKVIRSDADESYMHSVGPSFNSKAIGTFDVNSTSTVSERDEYAVRDLNQYAEGTKRQPSWSRGPAGKSTKVGSGKTEKNWSE